MTLYRTFFSVAVMLSIMVGATYASPSEALIDYWQKCKPVLNPPPGNDDFRVVSIGSSAEIKDAIVTLILDGQKTGTFTSPWLYEDNPSLAPQPGQYGVLMDSRGAPRAVLKTTKTITVPFHQITETETAVDGPAVRPLPVWRSVHEAFFGRELKKRGKSFTTDLPITVEHFEVVCRS